MSHMTGIQWTDRSSNPLRYRDAEGADVWACVKKSTGCAHCYAEATALRFDKGSAFTAAKMRTLTPYVRDKELYELMSPRKTPAGSKVFVCDMTDLFGEWVSFDLVDQVFAAFAMRPDVVFQVLTKRPDRMAAYLGSLEGNHECRLRTTPTRMTIPFDDDIPWPLPNVWLGTSVENQEQADERIPHLLKVPARVRFLSCEPLLGPVDLFGFSGSGPSLAYQKACVREQIHWVIVGGESGPDSRPMAVEWARSLLGQCQQTGVPVFVKQLGQNVRAVSPEHADWPDHVVFAAGDFPPSAQVIGLKDRKGGDPAEWPTDLRVRQFPGVPR